MSINHNPSTADPHDFSVYNRKSILKSSKCGCFYCLNEFSWDQVISWTDKNKDNIGQTALCPKCGIDSVLGDYDIKFTLELLQTMKEFWFRF